MQKLKTNTFFVEFIVPVINIPLNQNISPSINIKNRYKSTFIFILSHLTKI